MTPLIGRTRELALLDTELAAKRSSFVVVYGRRRIGKTELLNHFVQKNHGLFFVGKVAPAALELREFMSLAARELKQPLLADLSVDSWQRALELVTEHWKGPGKLVIVLDEFQWTAGTSRELPSVLQAAWDSKWKKSGKVMLVLCGSYVGFMEREVLGEKSPLFGRRTAQIHLQPFGFAESRAFLPKMSIEQQALSWFLTGGVAQYLATFDDALSFRQNVERTMLDEFAPLFGEPEFLLREELRDVASFHAVLMAIAQGEHTPKTIAARSGIPERNLHYTLEGLIALGYVSRQFPLTGVRPKRTELRFVLDDALLRFWFRFIFPNRSLVAQLEPKEMFDQVIAPQLEAWAGGAFERLCRSSMPSLLKGDVSGPIDVGAYWDKQTQIDVVAVRGDGVTELGECKWGHVTGPQLGRELEAKRLAFPNPKSHTIRLHAFVRGAVKGKVPEGITVHRLDSLAGPVKSKRAR